VTRRTFLSVAGGLATASAVRGQTLQSRNTRGKELIDQALEALGGARYLSMIDRMEKGRAYSFYRDNLTGLSIAHFYTRYLPHPEPAPAGVLATEERQTFGKKQDNAVIFIKDQGFDVTFRGARPLPDERVSRHRQSTLSDVLYILRQRLTEPGISFEAKGIEVVENQRADIVEINDTENRTVTVYLSATTHLPVMQRYYRRDAVLKDKFEEVTRYSQYVPGDGVMWPRQILREREGEKIYQMFADEVQINRGLADTLFMLPNGIPILKKQEA
jgi:hypothetical protein